MDKLYNRIDYVNNTTPALNETNLNRMSKGLDDLDNRVIDLAADIMEVAPAAEAAVEAAGTAAEAAETASGASETATGAATSAEGYASDAKNWAVGPSGSGTGTDTNNAKYWAEQAAGAVSGVSSFNGRSGAVTPQSGDYTADQVGATAKESTLPTPSSEYVNKIVQYVGATSGGLVHGYFYECVNNGGTYSWVEAKVQADVDPSNKADISAIGTNETGATCSKPNGYSSGDHFYKNGKFCTAIATIAQGATFTINTNYVEGTIADAIKALNSGLTRIQYSGQFTYSQVIDSVFNGVFTKNIYVDITNDVQTYGYPIAVSCIGVSMIGMPADFYYVANQGKWYAQAVGTPSDTDGYLMVIYSKQAVAINRP